MFGSKTRLISREDALPGRAEVLPTDTTHAVLGTPLKGPFPEGTETVVFAMGCFWGVERLFWQQAGVYTTAAGYIGGYTPNPTYREVCTGQTGHTEGVLVVYDPTKLSFEALLKLFWERHDPTQGMRQGNDVGTQYRSAIFTTTEAQYEAALKSRDAFEAALSAKRLGPITSEIFGPDSDQPFYYAEDYHQGYLEKNPEGYCGLKGTGVTCAI
ncbi:peptide-methionine (S)-S-oxide reductase MsrA [Asticcacaulis excentricus]|uniref:Peptide methionine sulfoxide reductase MsrA n=1 Tax=Asticcacaulis excentricus (strain ATCC 15261 / DSM 4724 / KCTC 12464 / NCIMB 9791 / VKM B-1370 / CB 48) TaxID=573065 RepID=E8RUU3_ASTEC|nr:peptide-methionine (S)-S-oxide reductase MsrA [Asticcacaulis excentricus]ADU14143.1 peptide methionine sulfoxide reductase [Asticcacaulis excentricus CB 48]